MTEERIKARRAFFMLHQESEEDAVFPDVPFLHLPQPRSDFESVEEESENGCQKIVCLGF